jgi:hypothetical protein
MDLYKKILCTSSTSAGGSIPPAIQVVWWTGTTNRFIVPAPGYIGRIGGIDSVGSLNVYKFRLKTKLVENLNQRRHENSLLLNYFVKIFDEECHINIIDVDLGMTNFAFGDRRSRLSGSSLSDLNLGNIIKCQSFRELDRTTSFPKLM